MVNFICDACGQTIKKQRVEKHYQTECRNCSVLSCIDCGKDFPGDSYVSHTSCITEAEKYQGRLYKAKDKANKGERKQQEWLEQVRSASSDSNQDPRVRKLIAKITSYDNVPRKEKKFKKFCENSINIHDQALLEKLWQTFSGARNSIVSINNGNDDHNSNKNDAEETEDTTLTSGSKNATSVNYDSKTAEGIGKDGSTSEHLTQKKQKKNKRKMNTTQNGTSENSDSKLNEFVDQDEMNQDKSRQKKRKESKWEKKKKQRMEEESQMEQANGTEKDGENVERKTKKKRKMEDDETNTNAEGTAIENRKKKKRKYETIEEEHKVGANPPPSDCQQPKDETGHQSEENVKAQEKFKWEAVIKKVLKTAPDNEMAVKKLRKKVINEFLTHGGDPRSRTELELRSLFEKKLHKNPKVKVRKEKAKYCQ